MREISGQRPEDLAPQEDIRKLRDGLKSASQVIKNTHPSELDALPPQEDYIEAPSEPD
jgi:hypothetical protein